MGQYCYMGTIHVCDDEEMHEIARKDVRKVDSNGQIRGMIDIFAELSIDCEVSDAAFLFCD